MKFVIKRDILLENLNHTSKAISSRNLIPILSGIKFELNEKGLYLYASDTDISIKSFIPKEKIVSVVEYGSIVIGGKYIVEIVRKLPDTDITIEVLDGYKMLISTSNTEFNLNGINPNEFPNLDMEVTKEPIIMKTSLFKNIINQTFFATSQNESRPILTGINFKIVGNSLEVIATDSYRLSKKHIDLDVNLNEEVNIVIPGKNLLELSKILTDDDDNLEMHIFNNKILFVYNDIMFLSRLLSGTYPATSSIIPTEFSTVVKCKYYDLYNMIDRASLLTSDREKNTIKLELTKNELKISSNSPEIGYVEEKISVENDSDLSISFSSKYMAEAIRSFNQDEVSLCLNNDSSPIVVKSSGDESLVQLVLPIKTY
mgnify:FL=1